MKYDEQFESSLSELAYSALQNSFPDLMQKVVGFQLVDANDEKTKALSLFALKMGNKHFYIPVFFVAGNLKPLELIYDKEEDQFLPLERDWISLMSKSLDTDIGQSMRRPTVGMSNPNLEIYATPPRTGRTVTSSASDFVGLIDSMMVKAIETTPLPLAITTSQPIVKQAFMQLMKEAPEYTEKLLEHYDWEIVKRACQNWEDKYALPKEPDFAVIDDVLDKRASIDVTKQLLEEGLAILDKRAGLAADAYFTDSIMRLEGVKDTGMYKIMDSSGEVKNYLAFQCTHDKDRNQYPPCGDEHNGFPYTPMYDRKMMVVDLGEATVYSDCVGLMGQRAHDEKAAMDAILNALPRIEEVEDGEDYIFLVQKGGNYVSADNVYRVVSKHSKDGLPIILVRPKYNFDAYACQKIVVVPGERSMGRPKENVMAFTRDVKALKIKRAVHGGCKFKSQSPKLMEVHAHDKGISRLELFTDGLEWSIRNKDLEESSLTKKAAAELLCTKLNMRGSDALKLIKQAAKNKKASCFIKQAISPYPQPAMYEGPQYAPMPMAPMTDPQYQPMQYWPEQYFNEQHVPMTPQGPRDGFRASIGMDNMAEQPQFESAISLMQNSAKTGDKDVMNAGTISSLSKICEVDDLIDSYLPDLMKAMDKIARMVFMYWYKVDKFADKYTDTEIKETEDMLRNLLKELGKTIYKFKTSKSETARMINYE